LFSLQINLKHKSIVSLLSMTSTEHPTWEEVVKYLFAQPYWIDEQRRTEVALDWQHCMNDYEVYLDNYESVKQWAVTIYNHLHTRSMPLTSDSTQFWPDQALELLRIWVNEGSRHNRNDPIESQEIIPSPQNRPVPLRIRKNILDLTEHELNEYRMKIETLDVANSDSNSPWQKLAYIHTNWCLHYQEAFLFWHRAYLLYLEELIDFPIPYWNWMSPNAIKDGNPEAGLPQAFKDLTYIHPQTGEERPNPLKFAAAKDGRSKACLNYQGNSINGENCKWVQRDPVLLTEGDDRREERQKKLALLGKYQRQVASALLWPVFSTPQGFPGYPWANITSFDPPAPDCAYPNKCDFDGLYEQPHDNIHGWVGYDMADNAYTAFDPIFWSYHSNIDRVFENWQREHPAATYTSNFPILPFMGSLANRVDFTDNRAYLRTTIGDMAKDSRSIGYDYEPPKIPDSSGTTFNEWSDYLYIIFNDVKCTYDTYSIDVFLNQSNPNPKDAECDNRNFVGKMMRLGMGIKDDKERCIKDGVTRVLDASYNAYYLTPRIVPDSDVEISLIVTDVSTGKILTPEEYNRLPGFKPTYTWSAGIPCTKLNVSCSHERCD
jgi:hypothetical protein